jgi:hypothetical protein
MEAYTKEEVIEAYQNGTQKGIDLAIGKLRELKTAMQSWNTNRTPEPEPMEVNREE